MAFVLLGLALEAASGLSYEAMIDETIFNPLGMSRARLSKPPDAEGVIPNMTNDWAADIGTYGPWALSNASKVTSSWQKTVLAAFTPPPLTLRSSFAQSWRTNC